MPKVKPLGESAQRREAWSSRGRYLKAKVGELAAIMGVSRMDAYKAIGLSASAICGYFRDPSTMQMCHLIRVCDLCRAHGVDFDVERMVAKGGKAS